MSDSPERLLQQIIGLSKICRHYQMIVNTVKSKVMIFGVKRKSVNFMLNGGVLEIADSYKYWWVIFNTVHWHNIDQFKNINKGTVENTLKVCFAVVKNVFVRTRPKSVFSFFILIFSQPWNTVAKFGEWVKKEDIDRIQRRFVKMILGLMLSTWNNAIDAEIGRYPVVINYKVRIIKYWLRITQLQNNCLTKKAYLMLKELDSMDFNN